MKKIFLLSLTLVLVSTLITSCTSTSASVSDRGPTIKDVLSVPYNGPKARIAVVKFENKVSGGDMWMQFQRQMMKIMAQAQAQMARAVAQINKQQGGSDYSKIISAWASYQDPISTGIKDMLVGELVNCNRFLVYERENIDTIIAEQQLASSSAANPNAAIQKGKLEGVELLIYGAITEFEAEKEGGGITIPIPAFGTTYDVKVRYKKAHVAMDLKIVDVRTGRIVSVTTVRGSSTDVGFGTRNRSESIGLPTTLGGYRNTPVEAAIRKMIRAAVNYIITKTPRSYYHYQE